MNCNKCPYCSQQMPVGVTERCRSQRCQQRHSWVSVRCGTRSRRFMFEPASDFSIARAFHRARKHVESLEGEDFAIALKGNTPDGYSLREIYGR